MNDYSQYGVQETNPIGGSARMQELLKKIDEDYGPVSLEDKDLVKITRLRLIGCSWEYPFWDVSYCYGELKDGKTVRVDLGEYRIRKNYKQHLVEIAKKAGRFGKGMGLLDDGVISTLKG